MNDLDLKIFIGNRLSNLYVTLERLIHNEFPRGLFNEYQSSILEISQLQNLEILPGFLNLYKAEIKTQSDIFKETKLQNVLSVIAACKTPTLLKEYCDKLLVNNLISFLNDEKIYIEDLMASRSRKKTKTAYLMKVLEQLGSATDLLLSKHPSDGVLQQKIADIKTFTTNKLQKLTR